MGIHDIQKKLSQPRYFEAILAAGLKGEIGQRGRTPWECEGHSLNRDMSRFMELTLDRIVVIGRKTWDSIPGPLGRRTYIILTQTPMATPKCQHWPNGAVSWEANLSQLVGLLEKHYPDNDTVVVAGGSEIYRLFAPIITRYHITRIEKEFKNADTFSHPPVLSDGWRCIGEEVVAEGEIGYGLMTYHMTYLHSSRHKAVGQCRIQARLKQKIRT